MKKKSVITYCFACDFDEHSRYTCQDNNVMAIFGRQCYCSKHRITILFNVMSCKTFFSISPPVEAILQLSTCVERTAVQRHHTLPLQLRESLSTVLQLRGHCAQCVVHPGCHLQTHTQTHTDNSFNKYICSANVID